MVYRGGCGSALDAERASPSVAMNGSRSGDLEHRGRSDEMAHFVGLDVSVKETSVCVVDDAGKVILEQKVPTEPSDIIALLTSLGVTYGRIGIEAGPLSQWLFNALTAAELPVICVETRHMKALLTAQQVNKTDRNDARGIAQMMRLDTVRDDPVCRRLMTAPGVGAVVALTYRATVDQPQRFVHSRAVGAHIGLTPKRYQSGEIDYDGGVSKCGDALLRTMLYEAAHSLLIQSRKWSWLKAWGVRVAQRRGMRRAIVAVARRLAVVLHRMWVDGSEFRWSKDSTAVPAIA